MSDQEKVLKPPPEGALCPRCLVNNLRAPALSRHDDETFICGECGEEEGFLNGFKGKLEGLSDEIMQRELRIPMKPSGRWFTYWPDSERPLWLEQILLRGSPSQSKQ